MTRSHTVRTHTRRSPKPKPDPAQERMTAQLWDERLAPILVGELERALSDLRPEDLNRIRETY